MSRMIQRLQRRVKTGGSPPVTPGAIATITHRRSAGSGQITVANAIPLQRGQLLPANLSQVSFWLNGVEVGIGLEARGAWPDGSVQALHIEHLATLAQNATITGELRLSGGFTVARRTLSDISALLSNTATDWKDGGIPDGVTLPSSAAHLCASSPWHRLVPRATQPTFTDSATTDAALSSALTTTLSAWDGTLNGWGAGAWYEPASVFDTEWRRTADVTWWYRATALATRLRTVYFAANWAGTIPEPFRAPELYYWLWQHRRDTAAMTTAIAKINEDAGFRIVAQGTFHTGDFSARWLAHDMRALVAAIAAGTTIVYSTVTAQQLAERYCTEFATKGADKMVTLDDRITNRWYDTNGVTEKRATFPFQVGFFCQSLLKLTEYMPSSTARTNARAQLVASATAMQTLDQTTSPAGRRTYNYSNTTTWYPATATTLAAAYTANSTTIQVTAPSGVSTVFPQWSVVIGGVVRSVTAQATASGGVFTLTLASGFTSGAANGAAVSLVQYHDGPDNNTVDLNGLALGAILARYRLTGSAAALTEAQTLYATLQFGQTTLRKQLTELAWLSPMIFSDITTGPE